jgi:hypothetical protein
LKLISPDDPPAKTAAIAVAIIAVIAVSITIPIAISIVKRIIIPAVPIPIGIPAEI